MVYEQAKIYDFDGMNFLIPASKDAEFKKYMSQAEDRGPNRDDDVFIDKFSDYALELDDMHVFVETEPTAKSITIDLRNLSQNDHKCECKCSLYIYYHYCPNCGAKINRVRA